MQGTRLLTVLVALGLVVGSVPGGALASVTAGDAAAIDSADAALEGIDESTITPQADDGNASDSDGNASEEAGTASRATVGQQLATVLAVTDDEVSSDVEASSLDAALEGANGSERAAILADRAAALRDRADEVVADQRAARIAYEDGEIARGEFAQRLAVLAGQARTVDGDFERVVDHADDVSALELRAAGYDRSANADARERLARVTGTGASALLAQYTGESAGEFSLEVDGGVSIEVEGDDGERSREFERDQPGNGTVEVSQSEALTAATEQLSTDADGEWALRSADRDEEDGYYEFEFAFFGPDATGEAEVSVDGQTGEVFEFEEELEPREADDEDEDADDGDDANDDGNDAGDDRDDAGDAVPLSISIANGTAAPGATVTLRVTAAGEPVEDASVELNDRDAGTTDADGRIEATLPDDDEVDIEVEDGDREGKLEITLRSDVEGEEADAEIRERLSVDGSAENGTVSVSVTYDGEGVDGVSVSVDGDRVGTTDENGALSFDAPDVGDELAVTLVKGAFEAGLQFEVGADGALALDDVDVDERDADGRDDDRNDDGDSESDADRDDEDERDRDDEDDRDHEGDRDDGELSVTIVAGDPGPGAAVTVEVTAVGGEPVGGASVEVEGESVGTTDADGRIEVTLPADGEEAEIGVEEGDREGELDVEFETDSDDADDADADDADDSDGDESDDEGDNAEDDE
ncbi:hypothetical protein [Halorubrum sp. Boch-26]|uniref:DUF7096 domain-containing protein n=1 Tax=Halorubrum sp. Boch-26 TaxID=2994426 RepID=UPI002468F14A|nr:hypothetical protein [Halorubrum sp. Boch-26]